jgi:hypothetical protein
VTLFERHLVVALELAIEKLREHDVGTLLQTQPQFYEDCRNLIRAVVGNDCREYIRSGKTQ